MRDFTHATFEGITRKFHAHWLGDIFALFSAYFFLIFSLHHWIRAGAVVRALAFHQCGPGIDAIAIYIVKEKRRDALPVVVFLKILVKKLAETSESCQK